MKDYLFKTILVSSIWLSVTNVPHISALEYISSKSKLDVTPNIFPLFSEFSLCVILRDDKGADEFLKTCEKQNKTVVLKDFMTVPSSECISVVLMEMSAFEFCIEMVSSVFNYPLYFINYSPSSNLTGLSQCLAYSKSPEVVAISLPDNLVLELSSVYTPPRHFTKSSVAEVAEHRFKSNTKNLAGRTVTVATMHFPPQSIFKGVSKPDGTEVQLFKEMAYRLNFTIKYSMFDSWGSVTANKTWDGGIGKALIDGEAEFGAGNIWQLAGLYKVIDFGPSYYKANVIFMLRKPEPIEFDWKKFLSIFQLAVWLATLIAFVFVIATCSACYFLRHHYLNLGSCTLTVFGHFLMTSSDDQTGNGSSRHVLTGWSVFSLLLTSCLSSGIVSRLTLTLYSPRVDTIQQLVEQDYYWTAPRYNKYNRKQVKNWVFNAENPWNVLFEKKFVYLKPDEMHIKTNIGSKLCLPAVICGDLVVINPDIINSVDLRNFRLMKEPLLGTHVSFAVKKSSPLMETITKCALMLIETGLTKYWKNEVLRRWPIYDNRYLMNEDDEPSFSEPRALKLTKLQPVFYMMLLGLGIASLVFLLEYLF